MVISNLLSLAGSVDSDDSGFLLRARLGLALEWCWFH